MNARSKRWVGVAALALAGGVSVAQGLPAQAAPGADRPALKGTLLTGGTGKSTRAADVSETGFIAGTSTDLPYDEPTTSGGRALRWLALPQQTLTQVLKLPADSTGATVRDVNELGEVSGTVGRSTGLRAVRWSVTGTTSSWLSGENSITVGGGETGWVVQHPVTFVFNTAGFVNRQGTETPLNNTPDLQNLSQVTAVNVIPDQTALLAASTGIGRAATTRYVLYKNGTSQALPITAGYSAGRACVSDLLPNGSVAYNGLNLEAGRNEFAIHRGGVGGTNTLLPVPEGRYATMDCALGGGDLLALDGTTGGNLERTDGSLGSEGAVWQNDQLTTINRRGDEYSVQVAAVATGGRAVIRGQSEGQADRYYFWKAGVRQSLDAPAGWKVSGIVGLTETGLVVGNVTRPDDATRAQPIIWRTS
jgi:hypothetical protein